MKPFYFHVFASGEFYADHEGCACSSLYNARLHAIRLIGLIVDLAPSVYPWRAWSVIVAAADGAPVLAVPFAGNVPKTAKTTARVVLHPRRGFPQVITYGDARTLGPPANEPGGAASPRRVLPRVSGNGPGADAPAASRRIGPARARLSRGLARLLGVAQWRWWREGKARRYPLRPHSTAR